MKHPLTRRDATVTGAALIASLALGRPRAAHAAINSGENPEASEIWQKVRASLFESRPIVNVGDEALVLDTPVRAEDASVVPIAMRAKLPHTASSYVEKRYLVIDNNPSPIWRSSRSRPTAAVPAWRRACGSTNTPSCARSPKRAMAGC